MKFIIFSIFVLLNFVSCADLQPLQYKKSNVGKFNLTLEVIEPGITKEFHNKIKSHISMRAVLRKGLIEAELFKSIVNFNGDLQLRVLNNEKEEIQESNFLDFRHKLKLTFIVLKDKKEIYKKDFIADEIATASEKFMAVERIRFATEKATYRCLEQFLEDISKQKL
ncbi:Hypothetical protein LBF_0580 [Leptospira biflexa serovar Patoc strain 'Patoc 1 (Ames)']|uniref:Lipoprotein n=1 Tax=Leptospira biflexa serovar Patoc (strain Patoc 1 / ATCC 23582 / Paris) TaxID=456481 RepID=B0SKI1_LEPBP|nr:hypothetical protein [Leptospira biflexa]ABZ93116.1 Hypothetical protein LBF_0580 [Leptospira biflexa serovar Patoc strain 'Patoc 1 (Ames)']ABZ96738.1 Hypothetical protein; putative signal peptide [Leptospira biflexa serovar Patoc strain 'Patoc 1 (Paris)']